MSENINHTEKERLIFRFLHKKADESEQKRVLNLLKTDDAFKKLFYDTQETVKAIDSLHFYDNIDEKKALKHIFLKANIKEKKSIHDKPFSWLIKIAALIVIGIFTTLLFPNSKTIVLSSTDHILKEKRLPDSSRISLNKNSRIEYNTQFNIKNRDLKLDGQAYFSVKKNTQIPFIINCQDLFVEVTGTSFTVNNYNDHNKLEVYVSSGSVKIYNKTGEQKTLEPGDLAIYSRKTQTINKHHIGTDTNKNFWLNQTLKFEDCPIQEVINDLNKYYEVNIRLEIDNIQNCRLSANFKKANLDSILEMICLSLDLELINDGTYILKGNGC